MSLKISGSFRALIASAVKFGFITIKSGTLATTQTFKDINLSYDVNEKQTLSINAFFNAPLYRKLYENFKGKTIPEDVFVKMLVKDYDVTGAPETVASVFIKGGEQLGFIKDHHVTEIENGTLAPMLEKKTDAKQKADAKTDPKKDTKPKGETTKDTFHKPLGNMNTQDEIKINIKGKGLNYDIPIVDSADWAILNAILKKVKQKMEAEKSSASKKKNEDEKLQ